MDYKKQWERLLTLNIKKKVLLTSLISIAPLALLASWASLNVNKDVNDGSDNTKKLLNDGSDSNKKNEIIVRNKIFENIQKTQEEIKKQSVESDNGLRNVSIYLNEYLVPSNLIYESNLNQRAPSYKVITSLDDLSKLINEWVEFYPKYSAKLGGKIVSHELLDKYKNDVLTVLTHKVGLKIIFPVSHRVFST